VAELKWRDLDLLVDLPPLARNFGQDVIFRVHGKYKKADEASALIHGIQAGAKDRLRNVRVFVHPKCAGTITAEKMEETFHSLLKDFAQ
jgi:hypothetical protein